MILDFEHSIFLRLLASSLFAGEGSNLTENLVFFESHLAFGDLLVADVQFSAGAGISDMGLSRGAWDRGALTRLSLAVLEDTGWYTPNWDQAMPLNYGAHAGCQVYTYCPVCVFFTDFPHLTL